MIKIIAFLVFLISDSASKVVLPDLKPRQRNEKTEIRKIIYDNNHYPDFDFKKKKLDNE